MCFLEASIYKGLKIVMLTSFFISILGALGNLIGNLWLARLSSPSEFGQVISIIAVIEVFYLINNLGFNTLIIQSERDEERAILKSSLILSVLMLTIFFSIANVFYYDDELYSVIFVFILSKIIYGISTLYQSVGRRENKYRFDSILLLLIDAVSYFSAIYYYYYSLNIMYSIMLRYIVKNFLFSFFIIRYFSMNDFYKTRTSYRKVVIELKYLSVNNLSYQLREHLEKVIISNCYGYHFLGMYERGRNIAEFAPNVILGFFRNYLITMGKEREQEGFEQKYNMLMLFAMLIVSLIMQFLCVFPDFTINLLLGDNWSGLVGSINYYASLSISFSLSVLLRTAFLSCRKNKLARNNSLLYMLSYIFIISIASYLKVELNFLLATLSLYHIIFSVYLIYFNRKKLGMDLRWVSYANILVSLLFLFNYIYISLFVILVVIFKFYLIFDKKVFVNEKN